MTKISEFLIRLALCGGRGGECLSNKPYGWSYRLHMQHTTLFSSMPTCLQRSRAAPKRKKK